jgi:asparagine synthase (glutamine-hydrolysing)
MCGIAGIFSFNSKVTHDSIIKMTSILSHRGPDGDGTFIQENIGMGHRRLSVVDLTNAGQQPMFSFNGRYCISYNGEVYNYRELRSELELNGYRFVTKTDTEVVLNAYIHWGSNCVKKFNGMFAFAIWDSLSKVLFLARDRYGIKPLYYNLSTTAFVFASEIKAIQVSGHYTNQLDKEGLVEYLTFQNFFTDKTLYKGVQILMPGHHLTISSRTNMSILQYWDFNFQSNFSLSENEAMEGINSLFDQAVSRQSNSEVPINAYLSGGIDSGAITMIAAKKIPNLKSFTIGFDLSSASGLELSFDERAKAEYVSYLAKSEHYQMVLKAGDMERCMDKYIWHLEEPRVGQSYPNFYAAKLASKFGKIVLSGSGGDEIFGGYPWRYNFPTGRSINSDDFIDTYYQKWQRLFNQGALENLLQPIWSEVKAVSTKEIFSNIFKNNMKPVLNRDDCVNYSLYLEAKTFLHGLLIVEDKLSMAHGLETRLPFLDNDLVDFSMTIPSHMKVRPTSKRVNENSLVEKKYAHRTGKDILRKSFSGFLDKKITSTKKQGFSSPDASWFRGESISYVKSELKFVSTLFSQTEIDKIVESHASGDVNFRLAIWSFLYLKKLLPTICNEHVNKVDEVEIEDKLLAEL